MKKHLAKGILVLAFFILLFPIVKSRVLDEREIQQAIAVFEERKEGLTGEDSLYERLHPPVGLLRVPKLSLTLPVYDEITDYSLSFGAGLLEGYNQLDGESHSVLTSHNGLSSSGLFTNLDQLENGDLFFIENEKGEIFSYQVFLKETVLPVEKKALEKEKGTASLLTCSSLEGPNSHRLIVTGRRVEEPEKEEEDKNQFFLSAYEKFALFVIGLFVLSQVIRMGIRRKS